jgi:feruloyl esterase
LSKDQIALNLQDSRYAGTNFVNATGNGQDAWKTLTYAGFANALHQGAALNQVFGNIDTDNADLKPFRDKGAKMITYHGLNDQLVTPQSTINYYTRASSLIGGYSEMQKFHRLFFVPGMAHCTGNGSVDGTASPVANPPLLKSTQVYDALTNWVENNVPPTTITVTTTDSTISRPLCLFPKKLAYVSGDVKAAASYTCK